MISLDWVVQPKLRKALTMILLGQQPKQADALNTLNMLQQESMKYIEKYVGYSGCTMYFPTKKIGGEWAEGDPVGVVDYYTANANMNNSIMYFSNLTQPTNADAGSVHALIAADGCIMILVDPLTTIALHPAVNSLHSIAIAHINGGYLEKTVDGFSCGTDFYEMKPEVPPQRIETLWWDPFEVKLIISSIVLKRLLLAAIPTLQIPHFNDYGNITFKNSGRCSPLWPFEAINTLVSSWVNLNDIKSLTRSELSFQLVKQFSHDACHLD